MATKKKTAKPIAKKTAKPAPKPAKAKNGKSAKPAAKKQVVKKPVAKKAVAKKAAPKPLAKAAVKKPVAKPATKKIAVKKPAPMPKKPTVKKPEVKKPAPAPKPVAEINIKPSVKQAIQNLKKEAKAKAKPVEVKPVKTSVSTSVRYQPDFTKSVLDAKAEEKPQGPMVRYSDADLTEFRELIQRKLDAAKKELVYLQGLITRKDEMGGDDGDGRYMTMEDGSVSMEREQLSQMASRQITYTDHLEKALMRIENKTYGICRVTGKLIDKARLRAVPHATLSMEAKMGVVRGSHISGD
jgi:RNA polymerase-binding transcription factor DksA